MAERKRTRNLIVITKGGARKADGFKRDAVPYGKERVVSRDIPHEVLLAEGWEVVGPYDEVMAERKGQKPAPKKEPSPEPAPKAPQEATTEAPQADEAPDEGTPLHTEKELMERTKNDLLDLADGLGIEDVTNRNTKKEIAAKILEHGKG